MDDKVKKLIEASKAALNDLAVRPGRYEALRDALAAIEHDGIIKIADGWVDPKSDTMTFFVRDDLNSIHEGKAKDRIDIYRRCFLSESAAKEFLRSERIKAGWRETADGAWVKPGEKCWFISEYGPQFDKWEYSYSKEKYFVDGYKAMAEFLKAKGGGK